MTIPIEKAWDMIGVLIDGLWNDFFLGLIYVILEQIIDQLVNLFTGNIYGIPGPLVAFLLIFMIGFYVSIRRWSQ